MWIKDIGSMLGAIAITIAVIVVATYMVVEYAL